MPTTTDRDELVERLSGPHEWGYRCIADGTFIADDAPFQAAARIQADAATIATKDAEALGFERALRVSLWNEARRQGMSQDKAIREVEKAVETLRTETRATLKGGDHG